MFAFFPKHTMKHALLAAAFTFAAVLATACGGASSPAAPSSSSISVSDPSTATSLTYTQNVQPILASDCVTCHNTSNRNGGFDLSSYTGVLRALTPGSANSLLVRVTQPGGLMYSNLRTTATEKSATIRRWVVDFNAAQ